MMIIGCVIYAMLQDQNNRIILKTSFVELTEVDIEVYIGIYNTRSGLLFFAENGSAFLMTQPRRPKLTRTP
jgi:hypothetical protein